MLYAVDPALERLELGVRVNKGHVLHEDGGAHVDLVDDVVDHDTGAGDAAGLPFGPGALNGMLQRVGLVFCRADDTACRVDARRTAPLNSPGRAGWRLMMRMLAAMRGSRNLVLRTEEGGCGQLILRRSLGCTSVLTVHPAHNIVISQISCVWDSDQGGIVPSSAYHEARTILQDQRRQVSIVLFACGGLAIGPVLLLVRE